MIGTSGAGQTDEAILSILLDPTARRAQGNPAITREAREWYPVFQERL